MSHAGYPVIQVVATRDLDHQINGWRASVVEKGKVIGRGWSGFGHDPLTAVTDLASKLALDVQEKLPK